MGTQSVDVNESIEVIFKILSFFPCDLMIQCFY